MLGMNMPHAHALFSHSTGPYSARRSGEACATPSIGKIFAPCMIPGTSTQKRGLPGKIRALCIRNRPIAPQNGYMGRRSCQLQRKKHAFRENAASEAPFFVQSVKRGYIARESRHSSQSNLEDRHNKSIGRQNANQKKILEQQPNRPTPRRHPQDHCSGSPKQRSNQPVTKTIPARAPILAA